MSYALYYCQILMKLEYFRQILEKYTSIKFHDNPSSGSRIVPRGHTDGQTDRHDETNVRFSQYFERS